MGRTASPVTPGTSPATDTGADLETAVVQEGLKAEVATSENEGLRAEIAELRQLVKMLGRNQVAVAAPEKVELPTMASVLESKPTIPVLTEDGWYVPPVHPTDRKVS